MSTIRIGTVDLPQKGGWDGYFKRLDYLELSGLFTAPVKPGTLARWASSAPAGSLGLVAPWVTTHREAPTRVQASWTADAGSGEFRDSPAVRVAVDALAQAATTVAAPVVMFQSPPMLSPSASNRDRLRAFFAEVAPAERFGGARRVWVPSGLWTPLTAVTFAGELGVVCTVDPLLDDPDLPLERMVALPAESLYLRPLGMGRAGALSADRLDTLAEIADAYADVIVAFATAQRFRDATSFAKLMRVDAN
ncbi:MAG: DUF72 domain-containing protein [Kofleriaceae bacterium]